MNLRFGRPYLLEKDYRRLYLLTLLVFFVTLGWVVWLNLTYTRYTSIFLNKSSPPFRNRQDVDLVHYWGSQEGVGWPWAARWTYEVDGVVYPGLGDVHPWRNISVAMILVVLASAAVSLLLGFAILNYRKKQFNNLRCLNCSYDLRGSVGRSACPECGEEIRTLPEIIDDQPGRDRPG